MYAFFSLYASFVLLVVSLFDIALPSSFSYRFSVSTVRCLSLSTYSPKGSNLTQSPRLYTFSTATVEEYSNVYTTRATPYNVLDNGNTDAAFEIWPNGAVEEELYRTSSQFLFSASSASSVFPAFILVILLVIFVNFVVFSPSQKPLLSRSRPLLTVSLGFQRW
jgi:hypothetical protein